MIKLLAGMKFLLLFLCFFLTLHNHQKVLSNESIILKENRENLNEIGTNSINSSSSVRKLQTLDGICSLFITCQECFSHNGCVFSGGACTYYQNPPTNAGSNLYLSKFFLNVNYTFANINIDEIHTFARYSRTQFTTNSGIDDYWWFNAFNYCPYQRKCTYILGNYNKGKEEVNLKNNFNPGEQCHWRIDSTYSNESSTPRILNYNLTLVRQGIGIDKVSLILCDHFCTFDLINKLFIGEIDPFKIQEYYEPWEWYHSSRYMGGYYNLFADTNTKGIKILKDQDIPQFYSTIQNYSTIWILYEYLGPANKNEFKFSVFPIINYEEKTTIINISITKLLLIVTVIIANICIFDYLIFICLIKKLYFKIGDIGEDTITKKSKALILGQIDAILQRWRINTSNLNLGHSIKCKICNKEYKEHEKIVITPCNHIFHEICLKNYIIENYPKCICLFCRRDLLFDLDFEEKMRVLPETGTKFEKSIGELTHKSEDKETNSLNLLPALEISSGDSSSVSNRHYNSENAEFEGKILRQGQI